MNNFDKNIFPKENEIPEQYRISPMHQKQYLVNGELREWTGPTQEVLSPIMIRDDNGNLKQKVLGSYPMLTGKESMEALNASKIAYGADKSGKKFWSNFPVEQRIEHMQTFIQNIKEVRTPIVNYLMWEIAKTYTDSCKEFDRTITYMVDTIDELKVMTQKSTWQKSDGIHAKIGKTSLGSALVMGPYNYPLNETYTTFVPNILMGNTAVMKAAKYGQLLHEPILKAYRDSFPPGVVNVIYGDGSTIITPMMKSGKVDVFAFIGALNTANIILSNHPNPSHLKVIAGLNAKNPYIITSSADIDLAVKDSVAGALSNNGARCTANKITFVERSIAAEFISKMSSSIDSLVLGMPWTSGVNITPMPSFAEVGYANEYVKDALIKGATIVNNLGGKSVGTFVAPTLLVDVKPNMRIYNEEQFDPIVPIVIYDDISEPIQYMMNSEFGQQASIFGTNPKEMGKLIDIAYKQVSRVNINGQSQRGPDKYPFTGRKSSGKEVLSIRDALEAFSSPGMVAFPDNKMNITLLNKIIDGGYSKVLREGNRPY
ncbi:MAG: aldehyde dehydrogenase family protein [Candidatus Woesearchaeota archaeon]